MNLAELLPVKKIIEFLEREEHVKTTTFFTVKELVAALNLPATVDDSHLTRRLTTSIPAKYRYKLKCRKIWVFGHPEVLKKVMEYEQ